ncbi:MAG TPA: hypothetical protein VFW96_16335 [Thermomicrobiales bacterium]|nr:hypothetical protein [Thermomicrobiales bacterium]
MLLFLLTILLIVAVAAVAVAVIAAILLAIGTGLALIFAVSPWQATVIATAVALGVTWLVTRLPPAPVADLGDLEEPEVFVLPELPLRRPRRRRR